MDRVGKCEKFSRPLKANSRKWSLSSPSLPRNRLIVRPNAGLTIRARRVDFQSRRSGRRRSSTDEVLLGLEAAVGDDNAAGGKGTGGQGIRPQPLIVGSRHGHHREPRYRRSTSAAGSLRHRKIRRPPAACRRICRQSAFDVRPPRRVGVGHAVGHAEDSAFRRGNDLRLASDVASSWWPTPSRPTPDGREAVRSRPGSRELVHDLRPPKSGSQNPVMPNVTRMCRIAIFTRLSSMISFASLRTRANVSGNPLPAATRQPTRRSRFAPSTRFEDVNNCLIDQFQPAEHK